MMTTELTQAARQVFELQAALAAHLKASEAEASRIKGEIREAQKVLEYSTDGIDLAKVSLAKTIVFASKYADGGKERASCVADAIKQFATGAAEGDYKDLWRYYFGTKSYDGWHGQREDHAYGYGPRHGSTIFRIGVNDGVRENRKQSDLTDEEVEAVIYYLTNLERIQTAESRALAAA